MTSTITARQYVVTGDWSDDEGQNIALATVEHMAKSVEYVAYSGDEDDARYFTMIDGKMTEVVFRCIESSGPDDEDYLHRRYTVVPKGDADSEFHAEPIDTFTVRIDGRA